MGTAEKEETWTREREQMVSGRCDMVDLSDADAPRGGGNLRQANEAVRLAAEKLQTTYVFVWESALRYSCAARAKACSTCAAARPWPPSADPKTPSFRDIRAWSCLVWSSARALGRTESGARQAGFSSRHPQPPSEAVASDMPAESGPRQ